MVKGMCRVRRRVEMVVRRGRREGVEDFLGGEVGVGGRGPVGGKGFRDLGVIGGQAEKVWFG